MVQIISNYRPLIGGKSHVDFKHKKLRSDLLNQRLSVQPPPVGVDSFSELLPLAPPAVNVVGKLEVETQHFPESRVEHSHWS